MPSTVASVFIDLLSKPCRAQVTTDGVFKPGRFTHVFGPLGAAKTTVMKTMSNRLQGSTLMKLGSTLCKDEPVTTKFLAKNLVGTFDQVDCLVPALTVEETFDLVSQGMGGRDMGAH